MITCKISPYPLFLAPIFYSLFLYWLLLTDFQKTLQTKGRTKVCCMNLNLIKGARFYEITVPWNNTTLPYSFETEFWFLSLSFFFFFRTPTQILLSRVYPNQTIQVPSIFFLSCCWTRMKLWLKFYFQEKRMISVLGFERNTVFLFHMFSCSLCMEFNK